MIADNSPQEAGLELENRLFLELYQCANMMPEAGCRAFEVEGLTTRQRAMLGALSRQQAQGAMSIGELARYRMATRQNLSGLIGRMDRDGHVAIARDERDRRSRIVTMTESGRDLRQVLAWPKIRAYYGQVLGDFSTDDVTHALHDPPKMLGNMQRPDDAGARRTASTTGDRQGHAGALGCCQAR